MWEEGSFTTAEGKASYSLVEQQRDLGSKADITSYRIPESKKYLRNVELNAIRFSETTVSLYESLGLLTNPSSSLRCLMLLTRSPVTVGALLCS